MLRRFAVTRTLLCALLLLLTTAAGAAAQRVEFRGRGDADNDAFLRALLRRGDFTLISEDRGVAANDTIHGDVLVADATLRLDGVITGDLIIVDGNVHLRPSARVLGGVRNIAGGFYRSELATIGGDVQSQPEAAYDAERRIDGTIVITGTDQRRALSPLLIPPRYDRVNGVTVPLGARLMLPRIGQLEPALRGRVEYASHRGAWEGGGELAVARRRSELAFGAERTSATNDGWIRSDLTNSISALTKGSDYRDYYGVDRAYVEARRLLERGARASNAYVRAQVEDAQPLRAGTPWSVLGDFREDNIEFASSRITSVLLGGDVEWTLPLHAVEVDAVTEFAFDILDGDHSFNRFYIDAEWAMAALRDHTLKIETHFQGPLPGTDSLPGQRWSFVGGSGTLYTFEVAEFRGDRIAHVETEYSIPLSPRLRLGPLGIPSLDLLHLAGMAWSHDVSRSFEQNVGARLSYRVAYLRVVTNPEDFTGDVKFTVGVNFPKRRYPWQQDD